MEVAVEGDTIIYTCPKCGYDKCFTQNDISILLLEHMMKKC